VHTKQLPDGRYYEKLQFTTTTKKRWKQRYEFTTKKL